MSIQKIYIKVLWLTKSDIWSAYEINLCKVVGLIILKGGDTPETEIQLQVLSEVIICGRAV